MLSELHDTQESDEDVQSTTVSVSIETRSNDGEELVRKRYSFNYAKEWDKWTFQEYDERRTPDVRATERNWRQARHIMWSDGGDTATIDVPPEVADELAEATDSDEVTLQIPRGGIDETKYEEVYST